MIAARFVQISVAVIARDLLEIDVVSIASCDIQSAVAQPEFYGEFRCSGVCFYCLGCSICMLLFFSQLVTCFLKAQLRSDSSTNTAEHRGLDSLMKQ